MLTERKIYLWFMAILLPLFIILSLNFPVNVDEILHYDHAVKVIDWYQSGGEDDSCLQTPWSNLKYYGQSVDNFTALINRLLKPVDPYQSRHITGAVFAWMLILFTSLIVRELTGNYRVPMLAALLLLLIPPVMGQYCNNLKDIPFATGYVFALYSMIKCFQKLPVIPWKYILQLSAAIAFLVSVRVGGLILYLYIFLFLLLWIFANREQSLFSAPKRKTLYRLLLQAFTMIIIGYFGGLLFWPYALVNPLAHPLESLSLMEHYSISIRQIFQGSWFWSTDLPDKYLFTWMLISIPEIVLLGLVLYAGTLMHKRVSLSLEELMILFFLFFPLFYVVLIDSNLYSGWRQMYFVAGPLSIVAALGMERIWQASRGRRVMLMALISVFLLTSSLPLIHYWQNRESSYVYFNSVAGGNRKAWSNFEYDYYWHGMKRASEWFDNNVEESGRIITVASNFDVSVYLKHRSDIKFKYVHYDNRSEKDWEYGIFGINYINPYQLKNDTWEADQILETIRDHHHPLAIIVKPLSRDDFAGVSLYKSGRYPEAIEILEEAILLDPNNFVLFEYLADSYYRLGQSEDCLRIVELGKKTNPRSEKLNMLEAQLDYDRGAYGLALEKTLQILKFNNKYSNIVPLLVACYERTGETEKAQELRSKFDLP